MIDNSNPSVQRGYNFDGKTEAPTVVIEILPRRYVLINGVAHTPEQEVVFDKVSGKRIKKWVAGVDGRVAVPQRIADLLCVGRGAGAKTKTPMARIVGAYTAPVEDDSVAVTKTVEAAPEPKAEKTPKAAAAQKPAQPKQEAGNRRRSATSDDA